MVALKIGSPEHVAVFGQGLDDILTSFESALPSHHEIQNSWCDPSLRKALGLDDLAKIASFQSKDMRHGSRALLYDLASNFGNEAASFVNFPTDLLSGLRATIQSSPIASSLSEADVLAVFNGEDAEAKVKAGAAVALGVGLAAVGTAIPVVGQIGAAVVALGKAIYSILDAQQKALDQKQDAVREEMYKTFPPLQTADSVTDSGLVQNHLRSILTTQDWTSIFLPRFRGEWVGIERDKGYAFAPGKTDKWSDEFGGDQDAFVPSGGVGLIPGTSILTSVIQVNLDPRGHAFQHFVAGGGDPRGPSGPDNPVSGAQYVIDTGSFYPATARLGALAWEWATRKGSPYLYRLDAVRMHVEWRAYCDAGIDYIRERVFPWYAKFVKAKANGDADNMNLEGFFGSAVYYGVGSWACVQSGGTNLHPTYTKHAIPSGRYREQIKKSGLYPGSVYSGAFLPILSEPTPGFQNCMGTIYYRNPAIRDVVNTLQARQRSDLRRTLVCAYVRRTDAAFAGDPDLLDLLSKTRALLLTHPDRFHVNMLDVPEGETHNGKDWRAQLLAAGVPALPNLGGPKGLKLGEGVQDPEPRLPPLKVGDPVPPAWKPKVATLAPGALAPPGETSHDEMEGEAGTSGAGWGPRAAVGAAAFGGLFAAGWAISKRWGRKSTRE